MIAERAPAKVNLYLHVGPTRADGLHPIESLFVFADAGDVVRAKPADALSLAIEGPFASAFAGSPPQDNLVYRAAELLRESCRVVKGAALILDKRLPVAAGVGGGSADAAAALRALNRLWGLKLGEAALRELGFRLGADVPACLSSAPAAVSGAGEILRAAPRLPPLFVCLANPGVETPTGPVFRDFDAANPDPPPPRPAPGFSPTVAGVVRCMRATRNDLEAPAIARAPVIAETLKALAASPGALFARMSGSGATAFALYASQSAAMRAARAVAARGWWSAAAPIIRERSVRG